MKKLCAIIIIVSLFFAAASGAYAGIATITVAPVTRTIVLEKGESKSGEYTVINKSDQTMDVSISSRYWFMPPDKSEIPLDSWLEFETTEFKVEPESRKKIGFTVTAPEGVTGELAAMISFKPRPEKTQQVNVVFSVSLYAVVKGTEKVDCEISGFNLWNYDNRDSIGMRMELTNTGNIHARSRTTVFIRNMLNKDLYTGHMKYGAPVYPGKVENYLGDIYNIKLKPGIYKAHVYMEIEDTRRVFKNNIYFIVGKEGKVLKTFYNKPKNKK